MVDELIYVYRDDILIFSSSLQEHIQHVRRGSEVAREWAFVKAVPVSPFFGVHNFVRGAALWILTKLACGRMANLRFPQGPAEVFWVSPIALTSTKTVFRWSSAAHAAFTNLKSHFVSAPILIAP